LELEPITTPSTGGTPTTHSNDREGYMPTPRPVRVPKMITSCRPVAYHAFYVLTTAAGAIERLIPLIAEPNPDTIRDDLDRLDAEVLRLTVAIAALRQDLLRGQ
jgi:hypothetical protein